MKNKKHTKKLIAPIIITVILVIYLIAYFVGIIFIPMNVLIKIVIGIIPIGGIGVMIYVLIERIKEIRSGYEDDISKYWLYYR